MSEQLYKQELVDRFWSKVKKDDSDCWNWGAGCNRFGYGKFCVNGKTENAHRVSYEIYHNRKIKEGMCILHSCDNPKCVNPAHLREGTHQENMDDREQRGRQAKGEKNGSAKLTKEKVKEIRERYKKGDITQTKLGEEYGVDRTSIRDIINFKNWND